MSIVSLGDQELVKLYVNGNEKAFELLITRHKDRVYRFILSKIKDPESANDYFQDNISLFYIAHFDNITKKYH